MPPFLLENPMSEDANKAEAIIDPYGEDTLHEYASVNAPGLRLRLVVNGEDVVVKFVKGRLNLPGPTAKALDDACKRTGSSVGALVRKMDRAAAIALAKQHAANQFRGAAAKGSFDTSALNSMRPSTMMASQQSLAEAAPNNPEELAQFTEELAHGDMLIVEGTQHTQQPAVGAKPNLFGGAK